MTDYNFLNLSPYDFEILSRDLLQKHLNCHIESFTSGADQGIDLRCYALGKVIIQCKRYKNFTSLYSKLEKEVAKVKKLQPQRYIITTSVELNPERKKKIQKLFKPYILSEEDIIGKEDLNNLLTKYPDVEKNHFKLWLSSVNILQHIINKDVINRAQFALDEIKKKLKIYVQNDSYFEALEILKLNRYVIISGIPGIGKTTLAEILVYQLLAKGIDEFVYLSDSINDGYKLFDSEKKQVFLFDDFLGRNFLQNRLKTNDESLILKFIVKINESKNKYLIFTTREYILNQAKIQYDLFDNSDLVKCTIDLSKYTKLVKAKILYNHLFHFEVPVEHVNQLSIQNYLIRILEHRNYSPRIIETLTKNKRWAQSDPIDFPKFLYGLFENPELIWKHAFENTIQQKSRVVLYVLLSLKGDSTYNDLYSELKIFIQKTNNRYSEYFDQITFKNSLKELENSFITIYHNNKITFQNPSIQDFLVNYIEEDDNIKIDLIASSSYLDLLLEIFSDDFTSNKISLSNELNKKLEKEIITRFSDLRIRKIYYNYKSKDDVIIYKLYLISNYFNLQSDDINEFIIECLSSIIYSITIKESVYYFIKLLIAYYKYIKIDINRIINNITPHLRDYDDIVAFHELMMLSNEDYATFLEENDTFYQIVCEVVEGLVDIVDEGEFEDTLHMIEDLESIIECDFYDQKRILERKKEENESNSTEDYLDDYDSYDYYNHFSDYHLSINSRSNEYKKQLSEDEVIKDIFNSFELD